ncbi:sulfurtransferase [Tautonia plasticadhaerens]|uniref:Sulfurtransferase n=1 Tax=Tautonia plasticadhaerens TaxID=2527974 RepID=A0A518GX70_9BACT|nr:sulfurtransferase [Tautonia plasticadhaerens]QDV33196.1 3-mercaptopyruvate sulfurtransferase [Tautonia plasticadhaerens]
MTTDQPLVSTDWLAEHLDDPAIRVLDIRGYVSTRPVGPGEEEATYRGAPEEFEAGHIPGAAFVDWTKDIIDPGDPVPAQVAPPELFAAAMGARGVGDDTHVIAVDHMGGQFATRLWWALRSMGHNAVSVLDGGFNRWVEEGRPVEEGPSTVEPRSFTARPRERMWVSAAELLAMLGGPAQILDARDAGQFTGARRRGPRGGHVPGAVNLPRELFFAEGGGFLDPDEVRGRLSAAGLDPDRPVVSYCNGGVAATVIAFQLHRLGFPDVAVYDGSWNEWGPRLDLPVEAGER